MRVRFYEDIPVHGSIPAGTWIFGDLERLGAGGRELAARLHDTLRASGASVRLLNDPSSALDRFPLLARLHAEGVNRFRAFRAAERLPLDLRFPVFLRMERQHGGPLTPLLSDRTSLEAAVHELVSPLQGYRRRDLLVIEFCDISGEEGLFNKYAAFRVGERIVPQHADFSRSWAVKATRRHYDEATIRADFEYVRDNPHAERLMRLFRTARIEYGRMDYALSGGDLQVWEINTNPVVGPSGPPGRKRAVPDEHRAATQASRDLFDKMTRGALREIDLEAGNERIAVRMPPRLVARARLERTDYLSRTRYRRWMKGIARARSAVRVGRQQPGSEPGGGR